MASSILSSDIVQEVEALTKRTSYIKRAGVSLAVIGGLTAAAGLAGIICSFIFNLKITDFKLDVPASVLSSESSFAGGFEEFGSVFDSLSSIMDGPVVYIPATLFFVLSLYKITRGEFDITLILMAGSLLIVPKIFGVLLEDSSFKSTGGNAHKTVEQLIDDGDYTKLISYLKSSNSKAQAGYLPFDYVVAQAGVKEDKPDVPVIKRVVDGYNTMKPFATVPGPVRYALEMSAFNDVVTDEAKQYQANQRSKSAYLSETGKQGGLTGSGLLLLGASILLWFRQMSRRVNFLKSSLSI
ncbi:hypothetical protein EXW94_26170 [Enterobacter sp. JMULE2]|uniref:hypothetical protein n=1 Tax=Enterobacter sp. JMULE2 TaxID=2518340 RepID=UPI00157763F4|nr:hypothetical protein [Enterobacter sp. JMULE2]NTZ41087.1 hypothetical protein [Enterobacter sp. JMULE2]